MMFSLSLMFMISNWIIRLIMVVVVTRHHRPNSALAWLLVIFIIPWVGLILYLLVGSNRLPRRRIERHSRLQRELKALIKRLENLPDSVHPILEPEQVSAVTLARRLAYSPILGGNNAELMIRNEDVINRIIADIDTARHRVHCWLMLSDREPCSRLWAGK